MERQSKSQVPPISLASAEGKLTDDTILIELPDLDAGFNKKPVQALRGFYHVSLY